MHRRRPRPRGRALIRDPRSRTATPRSFAALGHAHKGSQRFARFYARFPAAYGNRRSPSAAWAVEKHCGVEGPRQRRVSRGRRWHVMEIGPQVGRIGRAFQRERLRPVEPPPAPRLRRRGTNQGSPKPAPWGPQSPLNVESRRIDTVLSQVSVSSVYGYFPGAGSLNFISLSALNRRKGEYRKTFSTTRSGPTNWRCTTDTGTSTPWWLRS